MKKSKGFVDYYINEWHANNYVGWIKDASASFDDEYEVKYAWAELDRDPREGVTTDEWCEKFGIQKCDSIEELCEKSDYVIVLAPSNPETHLGYAKSVFKYQKNTYIDKTFAPDFETATRIFDEAVKYRTKFFSSSALRYAEELQHAKGALSMTTTGGGSNFEEYAIHQVEMLIKILGVLPKRVKTENLSDGKKESTVEFASGKVGKMIYYPSAAFSIKAMMPDGSSYEQKVDNSLIFQELIKDMLRFFSTGEVSFNYGETLAVSRVREAAIKSSNLGGEWVVV